MAINNIAGKTIADIDAQLTVDHYNSSGHFASVSSVDDDKIHKYDLEIDGVKIDLKRFSGMYCEIDKLQMYENEADRVWMIVNNDIHRTFSIKKQALIDACAEFLNPADMNDIDTTLTPNPKRKVSSNAYRFGRESGDKLAEFDISMIDRNDYKIVDMWWLKQSYD